MPIRVFFFIVGVLLSTLAVTQLCMVLVSLYYDDGCAGALGFTALGILCTGFCCTFSMLKQTAPRLTHRDGFGIVGLCWLVATIAGALPYITALDMHPVDAIFEAASGFTTTGATILTDIEVVPKSILLWRSTTHWLGGMGIIMLSLAILPFLGVGGMQLYKAEVPGPTKDKLTPRIQDTAMILWRVYVLMTLALIGLLYIAGMDMFDAVNHTFATVATGGFSTRNASLAAFPSPAIQWIIIVFMAAAGTNFALHFYLLSGHVRQYGRDAEFRGYIYTLLLAIVGVSLALVMGSTMAAHNLPDIERVVRAAAFQVVSICTTTGFITEDYLLWPFFAQMIILLLMFVGGCAGSTGGGMKFMRLILIAKAAYQEIFRLLHPNAVRQIKINERPVPGDVVQGVVGFVVLYLAILGVSVLVLAAFQLDIITAFAASLTCLSNVGPGFGLVGPVENFAHLPYAVKIWLSVCMLTGRLEIYAILLLFVPAFWKT